MEQSLIDFAGTSYVQQIQSDLRNCRGVQSVGEGIGRYGVQSVVLEPDLPVEKPSLWYEFLKEDTRKPIHTLIGLYNVDKTTIPLAASSAKIPQGLFLQR